MFLKTTGKEMIQESHVNYSFDVVAKEDESENTRKRVPFVVFLP